MIKGSSKTPAKRGLYTSITVPLAKRLARAAKDDGISQTALICRLIERDMDRRDRLKISREKARKKKDA